MSDSLLIGLSALQTQQSSKIISNPTVVTLNNTEALINVGQERPIPKYAYNQQTGSFEVNGFDYKPIGIILKPGTPEARAKAQLLIDKYNARGKEKKAAPSPTPFTGNSTTSNSTLTP